MNFSNFSLVRNTVTQCIRARNKLISKTLCQNYSQDAAGEPLTLVSEKDGIRTICLNDPKKRNALSLAMLNQLWIDLSKDNKNLRVIILTAKGPVFSAGHDLKELTQETGRYHHEEIFKRCTHVMTLLQEMSVPVIAEVKGLATAAGCQLVASCDMAVVSEKAKFATPGIKVGLFCSTPAVEVGRSLPRKIVNEMLYTGKPISAQDALLYGLVNKVVPYEDVERETMALAKEITEFSKSVIALGKVSFNEQMKLDRKAAYQLTEKIMSSNLQLHDGQEGIRAFIEKRKPTWNHTIDGVTRQKI